MPRPLLTTDGWERDHLDRGGRLPLGESEGVETRGVRAGYGVPWCERESVDCFGMSI